MIRSDVELLRLLSAFGIVWFHSGYQPGKEIAYSGLIVFLIFSSYFALHTSASHSVVGRAKRLLVPCVLWSILYGLLRLIAGREPFPQSTSWFSSLLSTPSIHLWYLPFTFFVLVIIDQLKKRVVPSYLFQLAVISTCLLLTSSIIWREWSYEPPFGQYMHALPAVFIGIYLAGIHRQPHWVRHTSLGLLCCAIIYSLLIDVPGVSASYFIGFIGSLILLRKKSILPGNSLLTRGSEITFGVYLIHPLILFAVKHLGVQGVALPIMSFFVSCLFIYTFTKIMPKKITRFLF